MARENTNARADFKVMVAKERLQIMDVNVSFQRTLRIPKGSNTYPLTADLGSFPIRSVSQYRDKVPASWQEHGGVFVPLLQREAMWLKFSGREWRPNAIKVAAGELCAVTGNPWSERLQQEPQDYLLVPSCRPWLDGINSEKDTIISQFIAPPLFETPGDETHSSRLQLFIYEPMHGVFPELPPLDARYSSLGSAFSGSGCRNAGGICYYDGAPDGGCQPPAAPPRASRGVDRWDQSQFATMYVHLCNARVWKEITGQDLPQGSPVSEKMYSKHGLPWSQLYEEFEVLPPGAGRRRRRRSRRRSPSPSHSQIRGPVRLRAEPVEELVSRGVGDREIIQAEDP